MDQNSELGQHREYHRNYDKRCLLLAYRWADTLKEVDRHQKENEELKTELEVLSHGEKDQSPLLHLLI